MASRFKICTDPKHLAWVSWTLLANNPVNKMTYLIFCVIDLVVIMFYSFVLLQRIHFANFDTTSQLIESPQGMLEAGRSDQMDPLASSYETDSSYMGNGIQLSFLRKIDYQLHSIVKENGSTLMVMTIIILGVCLAIFLLVMIMALMIENNQGLEKKSYLKMTLCLLFVSLLTFLQMPLFDIIARTIEATANDSSLEVATAVTRYGVSGLAALVFAALMFFLVRIFNICVPTEMVPWCAPISSLAYLNLFIKAGLVAANAFDIEGHYALVECVFFFGLQGFQAVYRVLFAPNYVKEVDLFVKTKDFTVFLIFFIGLVCKALTDRANYDLVYFLCFLPIVTSGWVMFETFRKEAIIMKVKTKQLKLEIENEFALYVLMTLVRDCLTDSAASQKIFGQLMDLMMIHIEDCDDQFCICDQMENFYELLRLRQLHNQEVFPLMRSERKKYKKIIDDQGLIGTVSNITDLTLKVKSSSSTMQREDENEKKQLGRHANEDNERSSEDHNEEERKLPKENSSKSKKRPRTIYKVNIDETKHRFLSELLYLFYFEMIQKFPDSFKIQLLSNYYALIYKKKEMLCVYQMRSFNKAKLSLIDQCCHQINEEYLLYEISLIQKANSNSSQMNTQEGNFSGDYFIKMNQLYKKLNSTIESLSSSVVTFWKSFLRPQMDVEATYKNGTMIADNIQQVFKTFNQLDKFKLFKDYQMYFQFAIVQLHILNDPVAYELYIGKMKSILEINKVYQKNFTNSGGAANSDQANFIIVNANGAKFGEIIQINNSLRQVLGWSEDDARLFRIEDMMPKLIRDKHPEFMSRYNKTGQSFIINNKVTMFIKKANGYVIPVELYIKFHYSIDYQYTFLAIIKPFFEMAPFGNGVSYNINQLIFLVVDNEQDGVITEFSEACSRLLSSYGFGTVMEHGNIIKRVTEVLLDFDFATFKRTRPERYMTNEIFEGVVRLDLNQFNDGNSMSHDHNRRAGNLISNILANNGGIISAKTRIFEERYSGGVLDMNVFCFALLNDSDSSVAGSVLKASSSASRGERGLGSNLQAKNEAIQEHDAEDEESLADQMAKDASQSVTGSSSSMRDSTSSMGELRNFHSFTEQATPKTLSLILKLVVALYLIMVIVASVNLGINITRQVQSENDVHTVRQSFDRMNWVSMNQLIVRVLINIANGYEPENSILFSDRFKQYEEFQAERVQQLKNTQSLLQLSTFKRTSDFETFRDDNIVELFYLSESNRIYSKFETMNVAFNLYIAKLTEMNSYSKAQLKGNLSIQTLTPSMVEGYRPSHEEQTLFFVVQNGNKDLRQFAIDSSGYYARESEAHAESNILLTKISCIISIVVIVSIGLVIAPILTMVEIRKYRALQYFLKVPRDKLSDLIKNCEYCLNMNDESRYAQIMKDYEEFLGIKLSSQQVEQLRQQRDEQSNISNQNYKSDNTGSGHRTSGLAANSVNTKDLMLRSNDIFMLQDSVVSAQLDWNPPRDPARQQGLYDFHGTVSRTALSQNFGVSSVPQEGHNQNLEEEDDGNEDMDNADLDFKDQEINANKFVLDNLNLKQGRNSKNASAVKIKSQKNGDAFDMTQQEIEDENAEISEQDQKLKLINNRAQKRRSLMIFTTLSILLCLSTYFIIAYFLAMKTFETASQVIETLEGIFYKGTCFDSAMNFLRESEIRNQSMKIKSSVLTENGLTSDNSDFVATDYYLDFCFQKERQYNKMRITLPPFFEGAKTFIDNIESQDMCEKFFIGEFQKLQDMCKNGLNGILNRGLTNAFYYMFTQILKENLQFSQLGPGANRNASVLTSMLQDPSIVQIIDLKAKIIDPAINQLKQQCMQSVISYIQKLLNNFITAFIVFIVALTIAVVVLILVGFKTLRRSMWDTNIILKIIPFETLSRQDRVEIKEFFNT